LVDISVKKPWRNGLVKLGGKARGGSRGPNPSKGVVHAEIYEERRGGMGVKITLAFRLSPDSVKEVVSVVRCKQRKSR
jgi:hypothetical protein